MENKKGFVQIYTGDGKCKTTAALGLCLRAMGNNMSVVMLQFLKNNNCSEHTMAKKIGLDIICGDFISEPPWNKAGDALWREETKKQLEKSQYLLKQNYDLIILDEIFVALSKNYITIQDVINIIQNKKPNTELVLTGRNAPQEIIDLADLVTNMTKIKHYFDSGFVDARVGIEC